MPFSKGDPNINRNGRPKGGISIVALIRAKLETVPKGQNKTFAQLLVDKYLHEALVQGNDKILRDLIDRVDGKALQRTEGELKVQGALDARLKKVIAKNKVNDIQKL